MSNKKSRKVVMLPTEKATNLVLFRRTREALGAPIHNAPLELSTNPIFIRNTMLMNEGNAATNSQSKCDLFHLYLVSNDDDIIKGDWAYEEETGSIFKVEELAHAGLVRSETDTYILDACEKIIATTDMAVDGAEAYIGTKRRKHLVKTIQPQFQEEFLNTFVESNGKISEVMVEYTSDEDEERLNLTDDYKVIVYKQQL